VQEDWPGVDVVLIIFCDFANFGVFLKKTMFWTNFWKSMSNLSEKRQYFRQIFGRKKFQNHIIHRSQIFRLMGDCLHWALFSSVSYVVIFRLLFWRLYHFWQKTLDRLCTFCAIFAQTGMGPMLWFLNIFAKQLGEKMTFLTQNKAKLCKVLIITLFFEKNANLFAENCKKNRDHNIDPWSPW
jgi:hypothetical protein